MREGHKDAESTIEILPEFQEALEGLEGFSHVFVLSHLNRLRPEQVGNLKVRPLRLLRKGFTMEELPYVGVFAIDSPTRPNPIGLSLVALLKIEANRLFVRGLDLFDGTPVLDIKPYRDDYRAEESWTGGMVPQDTGKSWRRRVESNRLEGLIACRGRSHR